MGENGKQKIKLRDTKFVQITSQFLVSAISLLSFLLLSYSSGLFYFLEDLNIHFTLDFPIFRQTLERKYVFLICIGLIAFLAKHLRFSNLSSSSSDLDDQFGQISTSKEDGEKKPFYKIKMEVPVLVRKKAATESSSTGPQGNIVAGPEKREINGPVAVVKKEESGGTTEGVAGKIPETDELEEGESLIPSVTAAADGEGNEEAGGGTSTEAVAAGIPESTEEPEEGGSLIPYVAAAAAAAEDGEGNEAPYVSAEDLKMKFDDFIRKMKKAGRIEALRQLITV